LNVRLYLHPMCSSSARVFTRLMEEGLLRAIEVVSLDPHHGLLTDTLIPSVPALEIEGKLVAVDPLEPEFLEAVLRNDWGRLGAYVPRDEEEAIDRFIKSFIYSSYLMTLEYLSGEAVQAALRGSFARAAIRAWFMSAERAEQLIGALRGSIFKIKKRVSEYLEKVVAYTFLREILTVFGGDSYTDALNPATVLLWLQAKASIGRAHLDPDVAVDREIYHRKAERIIETVMARKNKWVPRLLKEFNELRPFAEELKRYLSTTGSPY